MTGKTITIDTSAEGTRTAYLSEPARPNGAGILLLHEAYGLHPDMKAVADRYAQEGYLVLAPDLYWKKGAGKVFDYADRQAAGDTFREIGGFVAFLADVDPAIAALRARVNGKVAVMGVGLGGITAYTATATGKADAGVSFYPAMLDPSLAANCASPWLYHYATQDKIVKAGTFDDMKKAFPAKGKAQFEVYDGAEHGFISPKRPEFDAGFADQAHAATLAFLERALAR